MQLHNIEGNVYRFDEGTGDTWLLDISTNCWVPIKALEVDAPAPVGDEDDDDDDDASSHLSPYQYVRVLATTPDGVERGVQIPETGDITRVFDVMWTAYLRDAGMMEERHVNGVSGACWMPRKDAHTRYVVGRRIVEGKLLVLPRAFLQQFPAKKYHPELGAYFLIAEGDAPIGMSDAPQEALKAVSTAQDTQEQPLDYRDTAAWE